MLVSKYDLNVIPVINKKNHMLGIITVDDIIDVIQEENTEDILKLGGVSEEENINSTFLFSVRKRIPWLCMNLITAFIASTTVSLFSDTISKVVALAAAMPIVAGLGGNAGTQTLAVTIRGIALGELDAEDTKDNAKIVLKELTVGLINGATLGLITGIIMFVLHGNPFLGLIIFLAMIGNMALACTIGFLVPVTLKFLKIDPALANSVLLTAFTDTCGFFMFLGLATLFIDKLV
jgi:magnesium transporter